MTDFNKLTEDIRQMTRRGHKSSAILRNNPQTSLLIAPNTTILL